MDQHRWSVAVCVISCVARRWRARGSADPATTHRIQPAGAREQATALPSTYQAHSVLPMAARQLQPQVQPKVCWAAVVDATDTDSADTAHRCAIYVPACLSGVRPWRRRRLSWLGTGREAAARAQLRLVAGTLAACPDVPGHVSITSHRAHRPPRALLRQPLHPIRRATSMCRASGLVVPIRNGYGAAHLGAGCGDAEPVHPRPPARRHHTPHPAHAPAAPSHPPVTPTFSDSGAAATQATVQARWTPNTEIGTSTEVVPAAPTTPQQPVPRYGRNRPRPASTPSLRVGHADAQNTVASRESAIPEADKTSQQTDLRCGV